MKITALPLLALVTCSGLVRAQTAPEKPVYTYVAEYGVPRANWDEFTGHWEKQTFPVLERLVKDGTLVEFGATSNLVHTPQGYTHAFWWSSMNFAGTQRTMEELEKAAPTRPLTGMTHRDRLVRSVVYKARSGRLTSGFSEYNTSYVKSGKGQQWRELYDKYTRPVLEKLFEQGTILGYGVDLEYTHTEKMGARFGWMIFANAEAVDKANAAFEAERGKLGADGRRAMGEAFRDVYEPDTHRDGLDRVIRWVHK